MSVVIFFIAAIGTLAGAIGVITLKDPFYCVLALVGQALSPPDERLRIGRIPVKVNRLLGGHDGGKVAS